MREVQKCKKIRERKRIPVPKTKNPNFPTTVAID